MAVDHFFYGDEMKQIENPKISWETRAYINYFAFIFFLGIGMELDSLWFKLWSIPCFIFWLTNEARICMELARND